MGWEEAQARKGYTGPGVDPATWDPNKQYTYIVDGKPVTSGIAPEYYFRSGPVDKGGTPQTSTANSADLEKQIREQWGQYGNWDIKGVNRAKELADLLALQGVTSISDFGVINTETPWTDAGGWKYDTVSGSPEWVAGAGSGTVKGQQIKFGDKVLGYLGDYNLDDTYGSKYENYLKDGLVGWSARGEGNVGYNLRQDPRTGKYYIGPEWGSSSDKADILQAVQLGLMFVPGLQGLGWAGKAALNGVMAELSGGDFLKGAVSSGLGSFAGNFIGPIAGDFGSSITQATGSDFLGDLASGALTGATSSGIGALASGRDISDALLSGAVGGGLSSGIGDLIKEYGGELPGPIQDIATKYLTGQLTSQVLGGAGGGGGSGYGGGGGGGSSGYGGGGGGGAGGGGGRGDASGLLSMLPLLAMMDQQQPQQPQQMAVPQYAGAVRSPFGSILG